MANQQLFIPGEYWLPGQGGMSIGVGPAPPGAILLKAWTPEQAQPIPKELESPKFGQYVPPSQLTPEIKGQLPDLSKIKKAITKGVEEFTRPQVLGGRPQTPYPPGMIVPSPYQDLTPEQREWMQRTASTGIGVVSAALERLPQQEEGFKREPLIEPFRYEDRTPRQLLRGLPQPPEERFVRQPLIQPFEYEDLTQSQKRKLAEPIKEFKKQVITPVWKALGEPQLRWIKVEEANGRISYVPEIVSKKTLEAGTPSVIGGFILEKGLGAKAKEYVTEYEPLKQEALAAIESYAGKKEREFNQNLDTYNQRLNKSTDAEGNFIGNESDAKWLNETYNKLKVEEAVLDYLKKKEAEKPSIAAGVGELFKGETQPFKVALGEVERGAKQFIVEDVGPIAWKAPEPGRLALTALGTYGAVKFLPPTIGFLGSQFAGKTISPLGMGGLRTAAYGLAAYETGAPTAAISWTGIAPGLQPKGFWATGTAKERFFETATATAGLGVMAFETAPLIRRARQFSPFYTKPKGVEELSRNLARESSARSRATLIIRDKNTGEELIVKGKNSDVWMSPGGKIEAKESARRAAIRETSEELAGGKPLSSIGIDPKKIKKVETILTEREKHEVFLVEVDKNSLKLKPGSDVVDFAWQDITRRGYTGPTALFPTERKTSTILGKTIRSDEILISSRIDNVLSVQNRIKGLSTAERTRLFKEAEDWAVYRFGRNAVKGIPKSDLAKDYLLSQRGVIKTTLEVKPVEETFMRRGESVFLKTRAPKVEYQTFLQRARRIKPGTFVKFQKESPIILGRESRYDVAIKQTMKYLDGEQYLISGAPGEPILTEGQLKVLGGSLKRGKAGLYFQPPAVPKGKGYVGLTYLGVGKPTAYKFGFRKGVPTLIETKSKISPGLKIGEIGFTPKALRGIELETAAPSGTIFKITGYKRPISLAGKKVKRLQVELFKPKTETEKIFELKKLKRAIGPEYTPGIEVVTPPVPVFGPSFKAEEYRPLVKTTSVSIPLESGYRELERYKQTYVFAPPRYASSYTPSIPRYGLGYVPSTPKYPILFTPEAPRYPPYRPPKTPYGPTYIPPRPPRTPYSGPPPVAPPGMGIGLRRIRTKSKYVRGFETFVRKRGKWIKIGAPAQKSIALSRGARYTTRTLAASFKITPTKKKVKAVGFEFKPSSKIFRAPKKGERNIFIQRGGKEPTYVPGARLATREEKSQILALRRKSENII